jgi:catechol 2,3-dioxygenase-like lactoylglutathione lyase family enzyme
MEKTAVVTTPHVARVILYVRDIPKVAAFYQRFFDMRPLPGGSDGWLELASAAGGCTIALHQASVGQKSGAAMKLVFGVPDVHAFKSAREKDGLKLGVVHEVRQGGRGFEFCNGKDPAGNSISISSRGMAGRVTSFGASRK